MYTFKFKAKYFITARMPKLLYFFFLTCFLQYRRISGKSIHFDDKKIKKIEFYKNRKLFQADDVDVNKILVSKKKTMWHNK